MTEERNDGARSAGQIPGKRGGRPTFFTVAIVVIIILTLGAGTFMVIGARGPAQTPGGVDETPVPGHPGLSRENASAPFTRTVRR